MKFIIQRDQLMASIQDVMKAISTRAAIPILTGIKVDADENGVTLTGSDSNISIESYIPAEEDGIVNVEAIQGGSIVLQANYFPDVIRKLPEKTVEIETDENLNVTMRSGKAELTLKRQDAEADQQQQKIQDENAL